MDNKKYAMMDMIAKELERTMTPYEKWQRNAKVVCRRIDELVNAWSLGISMIEEIDVHAHKINGQFGHGVRVDKVCSPESDLDNYSYAIIWPKSAERIEIRLGGECFLGKKDPRTIEDLQQFDYQIVYENDPWRQNMWDLLIYVEKPEDVIRVLSVVEPHWNWSYV